MLVLIVTVMIVGVGVYSSYVIRNSISTVTMAGEPFFALNFSARRGKIKTPEASPYMFFSFSQNQRAHLTNQASRNTGAALQVVFQRDENLIFDENDGSFSLGFLYSDDLKEDGRLKKPFENNETATVEVPKDESRPLTISLCLLKDRPIPVGFYTHGTVKYHLSSVQVVQARIGYDYTGESPVLAFGALGGRIKLGEKITDYSSAAQTFGDVNTESVFAKISLFLAPLDDIGTIDNQVSVRLSYGGENIRIRRQKSASTVTLQTHGFKQKLTPMVFTENGEQVTGAMFGVENLEPLSPFVTDLGMIYAWPKEHWRRKDLEIFAWETFPHVLMIDFADFATQDQFFTRIAYFVEKAGYKDTFVSDSFILKNHGYNAHDYKAVDLARFYSNAHNQNFTLNKSELELCRILVHNGVLIDNADGTYSPGLGAVLSMCRQSSMDQRYQLMAHETWHGIYFSDSAFRDYIAECFERFDPKSRDFLVQYWKSQSSLGYDITDDYLVKNEFMAYLMQRPLSQIQEYYISHAWWNSVQKAIPELASYVIEDKAAHFAEGAGWINGYAFEHWGMAAGRTYMISR